MKRKLLQGYEVTKFCDVRSLIFPFLWVLNKSRMKKQNYYYKHYKYEHYKCLWLLRIYGIYSKENWKWMELLKNEQSVREKEK